MRPGPGPSSMHVAPPTGRPERSGPRLRAALTAAALAALLLGLAGCRGKAPSTPAAPSYELSTVTVGLTDPAGLALGAEGIYLVSSSSLWVLGPEGGLRQVATRPLVRPGGLAVATGSLFIADPGSHRIYRQLETTVPEPFAGTGTSFFPIGDGGLAINAQLDRPTDVAIGRTGDLFFTDAGTHRVRRVDTDGRITTVAGDGVARFAGDGASAREASLNAPEALDVGPDGTLYVADTGNHAVRRIAPNGRITTLAGNGHAGYAGDDGPAINSQLASPSGLVLLPDGSLLVSDTGNHRVRWLKPDGQITTVAGNGQPLSTEQADKATDAGVDAPGALALAPDATPFLVDRRHGVLYQLRPRLASPSATPARN